MRLASACGHAPVHAAYIVAGGVQAVFFKLHAAAAKPRQLWPGQVGVHAPARRQINRRRVLAHRRKVGQFDAGGAHQPTGTRCSNSATASLASTPSASASKLSSTRWLSTSGATACTSSGET